MATSFLVYDDTEPRQSYRGSFTGDPILPWAKHLENWFFLKLTLQRGNFIDRHLASKELTICERKMEFWERKRDFNRNSANVKIQEAKTRWQMEETYAIKANSL